MSELGFEDVDPSLVAGRATRGAIFLILRYAGIRVFALVANIILSRVLSPEAFGIYAITLFLLVLLSFVGDFGLGASLLQQRQRISDTDLRTAFSAQQVLVVALLLVLFILAPRFATVYHLGSMGVWFVRAMLIAGLLTSLKTAPTIVLERQLRYGQLALVEVTDFGLFQLAAVALALAGYGAWSFVLAVLVSKSISMLLAYGLAGWVPRFGFDVSRFRALWQFGLPFQLSWLTYYLRDYLIPILGGLLVTTAQVGYLNWALALTGVPGQLAQIVGRITLPALARFQDQPTALARALEQSIRGLFIAALPLHLAIVALAPWLIHLVFSDKWQPALPALYLLSIHWTGANLTSPLVSTLNAIGRVRLALLISASWTVATFVLALGFLQVLGFTGIALAYSVTMVAACIVAVVSIRRYLDIHFWSQIRFPILAATIAWGACFLLRQFLQATIVNLVALIALGGLAYVALLWVGEGQRLRLELRTVLNRPVVTR